MVRFVDFILTFHRHDYFSETQINSKLIVGSLKVLGCLFYCLMRKSNGSVQIILQDEDLKLTFKNCHRLLEYQDVQEACLKLLLIILTGVDNINENQLIEYLMVENMFESLTQLVHLHRLGSNADQLSKATDIGIKIL